MQEWKDVFTKDNDEGVLRVQRENYAFFMESTSIEYIMERNCDVTQVGGLLDAKSYGIAMQKSKSKQYFARLNFSMSVLPYVTSPRPAGHIAFTKSNLT